MGRGAMTGIQNVTAYAMINFTIRMFYMVFNNFIERKTGEYLFVLDVFFVGSNGC